MACLAISQAASAAVTGRITVLLSETSRAHLEVAEALQAAVASQYPLRVYALDQLPGEALRDLDDQGSLIVPVGVKALQWVDRLHPERAAVLALMVPRAAMPNSNGDAGAAGRRSAVYIDQPFPRLLTLARLLVPKAKRLGLILSPETSGMLAGYRQEAADRKIRLVVTEVSGQDEVPRAVRAMLPEIDALVMLADANVTNEGTVRSILLACYSERVPVIGFSRGLASAGAVAAIVSDPAAIGRAGDLLVRQWNPATGTLPAPRYAAEYALVINYQVARILGVETPRDGEDLVRWRKAFE